MIGSASRFRELFVEGSDDEHAIGHLLVRRGVDPLAIPAFKKPGSKKEVLRAIRVGIRAATGGSVGFVLDANDDPQATWESAASRLRSVGVEAPTEIPVSGFWGVSEDYGTRVGVWLMPDNRRTGALEAFLQDLIEEGDPLLPHAEEAIRRARELGARFGRTAAPKALLHTWLAWQKEPGRPYGVAIKARYFAASGPAADQFVTWFEQVFGVRPSG
ncbi:MAG: hypothetical protein F4123_01070 [Gemmatimonadetes bacterium]|nr:hypothetical protein [Gemmatimonadota bacterium]MYB98197.1 hypothetical protein [Gemmatimonadota bacterium]MYI44982.1 hypothetical protein [Gemmatimonadota bacterium]